MSEKIHKNFFISVVRGGKVVANYYSNSLACVPYLQDKYKGSTIEYFDIKKYGHSFGDAPVIRIEGGRISSIKCRETGEIWESAKECCKALGMPLKTLYTAIRRGSRIFGKHFEYYKLHKKDGDK